MNAASSSSTSGSTRGGRRSSIAHGFVGEISDRARRKGRQTGDRHRVVSGGRLAQILKDVAGLFHVLGAARQPDAVAVARDHLEGINAEEGVAPDALSALDALQQEAVGVPCRRSRGGNFQEGGDGAEQVRHHGAMEGNDVAAAGQAPELIEAGGGGAHHADAQREEPENRSRNCPYLAAAPLAA